MRACWSATILRTTLVAMLVHTQSLSGWVRAAWAKFFWREDARLNRLVALKILPAYFASDDARLRRFQREARAASALNHPNILTIHEVSEGGGIYYIATEFIDGYTIRELITNQELSLKDVLEIAEQIASALAAAHAAGIVHRDIKPENIMRRTDGLVKILDFGIAKLMEQELAEYSAETQPGLKAQTEAGLVMGTVNYMSPEQARGLPVDERTDIWSLGVVLYEMLAHRLPFQGRNAHGYDGRHSRARTAAAFSLF